MSSLFTSCIHTNAGLRVKSKKKIADAFFTKFSTAQFQSPTKIAKHCIISADKVWDSHTAGYPGLTIAVESSKNVANSSWRVGLSSRRTSTTKRASQKLSASTLGSSRRLSGHFPSICSTRCSLHALNTLTAQSVNLLYFWGHSHGKFFHLRRSARL